MSRKLTTTMGRESSKSANIITNSCSDASQQSQSSPKPDINTMASLQSIKHFDYVSDNLQTSTLAKSWANKETRVVNILRVAVVAALVCAACIVCTGVYLYSHAQEQDHFELVFSDHGQQIVDSFHNAIERNMAAAASLSNSITSCATVMSTSDAANNATSKYNGFPFVTLPHFEIHGSDVRAHSGSHLIHWAPLVTDSTREDWERYAYENRHHATVVAQEDAKWRNEQDAMFGLYETRNHTRRQLQAAQNNSGTQSTESWDSLEIPLEKQGIPGIQPTMLDDGYHPRIWASGSGRAPRGDMSNTGTGKYLPLWQRSAVDDQIDLSLNVDLSQTIYLAPDLIETMEREQRAILNVATEPEEERQATFQYFLSVSQYRHRISEVSNDWHTPLAYPVFDSFDTATKKLAGIVTMDVRWKAFFSNLLPSNMKGIICVIENSFDQSWSYQIDGSTATVLGSGDRHDTKYNGLVISTNVNSYLSKRAGPENRAYKTVHLSDTTQYTIRVYPSQMTQDVFITNQPAVFCGAVLIVFCFATLVFLLYSYVVEQRQRVMNDNVIDNVKKAAETERELNEFLSHEIRNPLSAAISACTFVSTAVNEAEPLADEESKTHVRDDIEVVNASLHFINDFMRSMLDIYRASGNKITVEKAPTDVKHDVLEPVSNILYKRLATFDVIVDCPDNLVVMTDSIRLKQVVLNLVRNASKFIENGFLRMRAEVVLDGSGSESRVVLYIEDSGPGVPEEKKHALFAKYQESLDLLSQGTGIGLNLSKKLMHIMGGDLYLDQFYDSGIEGSPGACFVINLNTPPLDLERELDIGEFDYSEPIDIETGRKEQLEADSSSGDSFKPTPGQTTQFRGPGGSHTFGPNDAVPELPENVSVLFVDDDAMLRKLFVRAVKRVTPDSWTIKEASSGEMALKICADDSSIDIIFLDQYMASVDKQLLGTETAQALRRKGIHSKIVGLSANDLRTAFINSGADDFILKPMPCKPPELKRLLFKIMTQGMDSCSPRFSSRMSFTSSPASPQSSASAMPEEPFPTSVQVSLSSTTENQHERTPIRESGIKHKSAPLFSINGGGNQPTEIQTPANVASDTDKQPSPLYSIKPTKNSKEIGSHEKNAPLLAPTAPPLFATVSQASEPVQAQSLSANAGTTENEGVPSSLFAIKVAEQAAASPLLAIKGPDKEETSSPLFEIKDSDRPKQAPPLFGINWYGKHEEAPDTRATPLFDPGTPDKQKPTIRPLFEMKGPSGKQ